MSSEDMKECPTVITHELICLLCLVYITFTSVKVSIISGTEVRKECPTVIVKRLSKFN